MADGAADPWSLPPKEAIDFFRGKVNVPTRRWDDLSQSEHDYGFMVAGARKGELLTDLRQAADAALAEGQSKQWFRDQFYKIAERHGWQYYDKPDTPHWRADLVYGTNLGVAYAAGRHEQMTDPDVLEAFPYWRYVHSGSAHPRPAHLAWNGTVLPADSPWWATHSPPNGYHCGCRKEPVSEVGLRRLGKTRPDSAPTTASSHYGIDRGWAYTPGESRLTPMAREALAQADARRADKWQQLTPGHWRTAGRPERLPPRPAPAPLAPVPADLDQARQFAIQALDGDDKVFRVDGIDYPVAVSATALAGHKPEDLKRLKFLSWLPELLQRPQEVWAGFERPTLTPEEAVAVRRRQQTPPRARFYLRLISVVAEPGRSGLPFLVVAGVNRLGIIEAFTVIPMGDVNYLNRQRQGTLLRADDGAHSPRSPGGGAGSTPQANGAASRLTNVSPGI